MRGGGPVLPGEWEESHELRRTRRPDEICEAGQYRRRGELSADRILAGKTNARDDREWRRGDVRSVGGERASRHGRKVRKGLSHCAACPIGYQRGQRGWDRMS